jgi:methionyl-tRNA synthetase
VHYKNMSNTPSTGSNSQINIQSTKDNSPHHAKNQQNSTTEYPIQENNPSTCSYADFKKIEMRVGLIKTAEPVIGTDKLLRLTVDFGEAEPRQVVSGIAQRTSPEAIVGTKAIFVTNLEVRTIRGLESQAMILGASEKNAEGVEIAFGIARLDKDCSPGALIG